MIPGIIYYMPETFSNIKLKTGSTLSVSDSFEFGLLIETSQNSVLPKSLKILTVMSIKQWRSH